MTPRYVTVTPAELRDLTVLESARVNRVAGIRPSDRPRLVAAGMDPDNADPKDVEDFALWMYAAAWQLRLRDEPGISWAEAQTWRVELDVTSADDGDRDEAEAVVSAAILTGLPPSEAGALRIRELDVYERVAERVAERARTG